MPTPRASKLKLLFHSDLTQSILAFAIRLGTGLASYLLFAAVARVAGPEEFGIFSIMFSAAMMIGTAGSFGQQVFLVKEIPQAIELKQPDREFGALIFSAIVTLAFSILGGIIYATLSPIFTGVHAPLALLAGAALAFFYAISQTTMGVLRVEEKTLFAMATRDLLWRFLSIIGIGIIALLVGAGQVNAFEALGVLSAALLPVLLVHFAAMVPSLVRKHHHRVASIPWKAWLETSAGLALIAVISSADLYIYTIAVGYLMPASETGAFFAALKTVELLNLFLMAVTLVISPEISRMIAKGDPVALQKKCNAAIILQGTPAIVAALVMLIAAPLFMWFFDPSFMDSSNLLRLLVIGMLINALTGATVLMLQLGGLHWLQVLFQGGSLVASILALPYLVSAFGIYGAAIAFILSKALWNLLAIMAIRHKLHVDPSILGLIDPRTGGLKGLMTDLAVQLRFSRN